MNTTPPPASAARWLKRLVPAGDYDVLLGDLHEEYQHGRSGLWYWFQIVAALAASSWKDIREHKLSALGAGTLAIGWLLIVSPALFRGVVELTKYWRPTYPPSGVVAVYKAVNLTSSVVLGWLIVRVARTRGVTLVVAYCGFMLSTIFVLFLWYGTLAALGSDNTAVVHSIAVNFQSALSHQFVQDLLMLSAGFLATRRPETA